MPGGNMRLESVATSDRRKTAALDLIEQQEHVLQVIDPCGRTGPKHGNSLLNCCTTINYSLFHQWFTNDSPMIHQWFTNDSPMIHQWFTNDSPMIHQWFTNDSPMIHQWFTNDSPMIPQWFTNDSPMIHQWFTNDSPMIHQWFTNDSPMIHQWFTNDSPMIHSRTTWQDRFASGVEDKEGAWVKFSTKTSIRFIRWSKLCIDSVSPIFLHFSLSFCLALRADSQAFNASLSWVAWSREEFTMTAVTSTLPAFHVRSQPSLIKYRS